MLVKSVCSVIYTYNQILTFFKPSYKSNSTSILSRYLVQGIKVFKD